MFQRSSCSALAGGSTQLSWARERACLLLSSFPQLRRRPGIGGRRVLADAASLELKSRVTGPGRLVMTRPGCGPL